MKLFFFPVAPNPTKVRLYLAEKAAAGRSIAVEQVSVNLIAREHRAPEHLARNPFGTVPVLELDSGRHLIESLVIIDYLERLHPEPSLYGADPESWALARQLERIADLGVLLSVARVVHATDSPVGYPANPAVADYFRERMKPNLAHLESQLADGRPFLAGDRVTVADCTLAAGLQFGRFRKVEPLAAGDYPMLAAWDARYRARETAKAVLVL